MKRRIWHAVLAAAALFTVIEKPASAQSGREIAMVASFSDLSGMAVTSDGSGPYVHRDADNVGSVLRNEINYFLDLPYSTNMDTPRAICLAFPLPNAVFAPPPDFTTLPQPFCTIGYLNTSPSPRVSHSDSWINEVAVGNKTFRKMQIRFSDRGKNYYVKFGSDNDQNGTPDSDELDVQRSTGNRWTLVPSQLVGMAGVARLYTTNPNRKATGLLPIADYYMPFELTVCAPSLGPCD